jgi:hypothetical protein
VLFINENGPKEKKKISACVSASFGCMTSKEGAHNVRSRKKRKETTTAQFSNEKPQNKNSFWFKTFFFFFQWCACNHFQNEPKVK